MSPKRSHGSYLDRFFFCIVSTAGSNLQAKALLETRCTRCNLFRNAFRWTRCLIAVGSATSAGESRHLVEYVWRGFGVGHIPNTAQLYLPVCEQCRFEPDLQAARTILFSADKHLFL